MDWGRREGRKGGAWGEVVGGRRWIGGVRMDRGRKERSKEVRGERWLGERDGRGRVRMDESEHGGGVKMGEERRKEVCGGGEE